MAGLEALASFIYHEKQQSGSMLCAQHALNSLLQENYFTAPDLSDIARNLDRLEEQYDVSNTGNGSHNMDDTGFFSVQVLENALRVLGLGLTRWRGEEMRPYQNHPHTQLAFILNLEQHWFTLRRFGHALSNLDDDPGEGHWFNLNSSLSAPEWVGKLYLGMFLQQAETDGYSVFAVTQIDTLGPLALHRTEADDIASTLPEPRGASHLSMQSISAPFTKTRPSSSAPTPNPSAEASGFEDEDYELQAALQASLMGSRSAPLAPPRIARAFAPLPPSDPHTPLASNSGIQTPTYDPLGSPPEDPQAADLDPVAASMERNRRVLQRMRAEQEHAQRELAENPEDVAIFETRRRERQREEDEEAEQLRRAIEESEAMARDEGHARGRDDDDDDDDDDGDYNDDYMDAEEPVPQTTRPNLHPAMATNRVYDDDDAELQAALKASLEQVPEGWELPNPIPRRTHMPSSAPFPRPADNQNSIHQELDREETESVLSDDTTTSVADNMSSDPSEEAVSVDEMRKRRLARFGA